MKIGVVSRSFPQRSHLEIATLLQEAGAVSTELCLHSSDTHYWVYNGRSDTVSYTHLTLPTIA